jgi:hypothetical protein
MDFITISENGRIRCTFTTAKRLSLYAYFIIWFKWLNEDITQVPESEHDQIVETFTDILSFLLSIENTDQHQQQFHEFDHQLEILVATINVLKE